MKKIEKGKLILQQNSKGQFDVIFHPINGTVWMDKNELCELFDCYTPVLDRCWKEIFKTKIFSIEEVCKYHRVVKGDKISYDIWAVNLKVIIAMSFRLESAPARILREWFVEQCLKQGNMCMTDCFSLN